MDGRMDERATLPRSLVPGLRSADHCTPLRRRGLPKAEDVGDAEQLSENLNFFKTITIIDILNESCQKTQ